MKALTAGGYLVEIVSTTDRGSYYLVRTPYGSKVTLDPWDTHSKDEILNLAQLTTVLARHGQDVPPEMKGN